MLQAYQTSDFAYQGAGLFAYQDEAGDVPVVDLGGGGNSRRRRKYPKSYHENTYPKSPPVLEAVVQQTAINTVVLQPRAAPMLDGPEDDDEIILKAVLLKYLND